MTVDWTEALHPRDGHGRFASKMGYAKALLKAVSPREAEAEEYFRKLSDPKDGEVFEEDFGFGLTRFTYSAASGAWAASKKMPNGTWMPSSSGTVPNDFIRSFVVTMPNGKYTDTKAFEKFLGKDPDKFLKRRKVNTPTGWKQVDPDEAYDYEPELGRMLWDPENMPTLLFKSEHGDVVRITDDRRFHDSEIRQFLAHQSMALDMASAASPHIRKKPVEIVVPATWDEEEGVKGYVRPIIPDVVNINPSVLLNSNETRFPNYWALLDRAAPGSFNKQAGTVDPQTYFTLHELGHIVGARSNDSGALPSPEEMLFWQDNQRGLSKYGKSAPAEGYAEAFAQWALAIKDGLLRPSYSNEIMNRAGKLNLEAARIFAEHYGWTGEVKG